MQSSSANNIIQISSKNHAVVHQDGHQLIVSKLDESGTITIHDGDTSTAQTIQTIYPNHYVDQQTTDQTIYATPNTHIQYQDYAPVIYTVDENSSAYYHPSAGQVISNSSTPNEQSICLQQNEQNFLNSASLNCNRNSNSAGSSNNQDLNSLSGSYLLQNQTLLNEDDQNNSLSHTAKASPVTVSWLLSNYETAEGVSLPRSTLYFHYLQHCHENKLEPMNPASFGKLIRSVFLGLRTRRLGTRGNSKYHYYGIRIKPSSLLNHYIEENTYNNRSSNYRNSNSSSENDWKVNVSENNYYSNSCGSVTENNQPGITLQAYNENIVTSSTGCSSDQTQARLPVNQFQNNHAHYLGETNSTLPNLEEICTACCLPMPHKKDDYSNDERESNSSEEIQNDDIIEFIQIYADSATEMLSAIVNLDFSSISGIWKVFWKTEDNKDELTNKKVHKRLGQLVNMPEIQQFIRLYDHTFYQSLAEVLIPNVLRPIPPTLTQAIRNFAKSLEGWMRTALQNLDPSLIQIKISAVCALAQTLRRYTSLNHLAQAARAVLKNMNQMSQMLSDLNRVDLNNVQEQASWVCSCSDSVVNQIFQDFKKILSKQATLEEWAQWLDSVVNKILEPSDINSQEFTNSAHLLMLKWSFYSSMIIRDLTLRSAASFGSFHLIRLLFDEYIFYLIEHKVAGNWGITPVAVMGEIGRSIMKQNPDSSMKRSYTDSSSSKSSTNRTTVQLPTKIRKIMNGTAENATQIVSELNQVSSSGALVPVRQVSIKKTASNLSNIHIFTTSTGSNVSLKRYVKPLASTKDSNFEIATSSINSMKKSRNEDSDSISPDNQLKQDKTSKDKKDKEFSDGDEDEYDDENSEEHSMLLQAATRLREQMVHSDKINTNPLNESEMNSKKEENIQSVSFKNFNEGSQRLTNVRKVVRVTTIESGK